MEKMDLCRLCLANSMNANMLPSTKTMERTMRQFNMLYTVSAQLTRRILQSGTDRNDFTSHLQKVDSGVDGLKLVCEPCWTRIDDFRQFSMHVENIHISYVRHFLKDDGTFNGFDDIAQYYVQVDDIHNMYAKQLLKNGGGDDKKLDYIEPFCVINVDDGETNESKNNSNEASTSTAYAAAESDQLSVGVADVSEIENEAKCKGERSESTANSSYESTTLDDDGEMDEDGEYEGESESSEDHEKPPAKAKRKHKKSRTTVSDGSNRKAKCLRSEIDSGSADDRSILLLKYVEMKCDLCTQREFPSFSDVQRHFWAEHDQNGYVRCCNRKFRRLARILQHCRWHENPEAFK